MCLQTIDVLVHFGGGGTFRASSFGACVWARFLVCVFCESLGCEAVGPGWDGWFGFLGAGAGAGFCPVDLGAGVAEDPFAGAVVDVTCFVGCCPGVFGFGVADLFSVPGV